MSDYVQACDRAPRVRVYPATTHYATALLRRECETPRPLIRGGLVPPADRPDGVTLFAHPSGDHWHIDVHASGQFQVVSKGHRHWSRNTLVRANVTVDTPVWTDGLSLVHAVLMGGARLIAPRDPATVHWDRTRDDLR